VPYKNAFLRFQLLALGDDGDWLGAEAMVLFQGMYYCATNCAAKHDELSFLMATHSAASHRMQNQSPRPNSPGNPP
jgi:hypothetical protein